MNHILSITSAANPKLKAAIRLQNKRERDETHTFLIEGYRESQRAVEHGFTINEFFFCPELFLGENERALLSRAESQGASLIQLPEHLFTKLSYRDRPDGLVAVGRKKVLSIQDAEALLQKKKNPLIVLVEAVEKPGNLGTILRSSDASAVDLVIVANCCTDIWNPNVVRASTGVLFSLPILETSNEEAFNLMKRLSIPCLAATPSGNMLYWDAPLHSAVAILMGTEQLGLSRFWMDNAEYKVRIPMNGAADSLNVAQATTLFLFEAVRQRYEHSL